MNQVNAERLHIGFFGLRNAGKSSLVNKKQGITIEYDLLNLNPGSNYFDSSYIRLVILNEPNREFRETKEEIIKAYYRYKYRN